MKKLFLILSILLLSACATTPPVVSQAAAPCTQNQTDARTVQATDDDVMNAIVPAAESYVVKRRCNLGAAMKAGGYDWVDADDFTQYKFPAPENCREGEEVRVALFIPQVSGQLFLPGVPTDRVRRGISQWGYQPADWSILLALGEQYPALQRKFRLISLGVSGSDDVFSVLTLTENNGERIFMLGWLTSEFTWADYQVMVAIPVRK